jgi:VTC domain
MEAVGGHALRHEVKFAAYIIDYDAIRHWLNMQPVGFCSAYPDRRVNNIYFDTWDYRAYAENLAGVSERTKLRYRWYGDSVGPAKGTLEVKQKRNHFGVKHRFVLPHAPYKPGDDWKAIRAAIRDAITPSGHLWFDQNPFPVMLNRYTREYFQTADGKIRATIDTEQQVYDQRLGREPNFDRRVIMQDTLVVEFKFAREDRQLAVELLAKMPLRVGRHSKYMNAVRALAMV